MVNSIIVTNYLGESIVLELGKPEESGFLITSIDGLGPGKANINTTNKSGMDGSKYNSAKRENRNIVIHLKFISDGTDSIEDIRQRTYKYFPIKKNVEIIIVTDNRVCHTNGYVESNEPSIFDQQEGCNISVICTDPNFYNALGWNSCLLYGVKSLFEFPFSNESFTEDLIEFGSVQNKMESEIYYDGDSESGILIKIHATGNVGDITIYNTGTRETMKLSSSKIESLTGYGIVSGDDIEISTFPGNKYVTLTRNGYEVSILNCLDRKSNWFKLVKGVNKFAYKAENGGTKLEFNILYKTVYEGV